MKIWQGIIVIGCLAAAAWGTEKDLGWCDQPRTAFCGTTKTAPVIDGNLDDPCWQEAEVQTHFFTIGKPDQAFGQTEVLCLRDRTAVYFAFRCHLTDLERRKSNPCDRDGMVWGGESVELFLAPAEDLRGKVWFHFIVNTLGNIYDERSDRSANKWNAKLQVAVGAKPTQGRAGYWTVELAIPLADLEATPKEGDMWRANFCRTSGDTGEMTTWMPILGSGFCEPDRFGRLALRKATAADLAQRAEYEKLIVGETSPAKPVATAIAIGDAPILLRKLAPSDCRVLRAFVGEPMDGTVHSLSCESSAPREYPSPSVGAGISYHYNRNDGLHVTLTDDLGVDLVVLRGRARTLMYTDATHIAQPGNGKLAWTFGGGFETEVARLPERAKTRRFSFFQTRQGTIADVAFYRLETPKALGASEIWTAEAPLNLPAPASKFDVGSIPYGMADRYAPDQRRTLLLRPGPGAAEPLSIDKSGALHLVTEPFAADQGLTAVGFEAKVTGVKGAAQVTLAVQDPLNPRRDVAWLRFVVPESGILRPIVDIPDQVLLKGTRLWLTLMCDQPAQVTGPEGGTPAFRLFFTPRAQALPEALAYRKFLLRTQFGQLSEPRPWENFRPGMTREEFFAKYKYATNIAELFMTIDQCTALDPTDDMTRQYREWVFCRSLGYKLNPVTLPPAPPPAVPGWAWYARLAWLETRRITDWWFTERMVPTGEMGVGGIGDDGDLYQEFADLPFFETGGVAAKVLDGAARIAEIAERDHLKGGLNIRATDALHAYEEGINHTALMARWFYGDPIYMERCMESARNMEKLTIVMPDGRRHFRNYGKMGYEDVLQPAEPEVDGGTAPLMWHTTLQVADYNRNPRAMQVLREWADTWLAFMKPPDWPTAIEVRTGKILASSKDMPLTGGYGSQTAVFVWLYGLTGDKRYIEPFLYYYRKGEAPYPASKFLGDVQALGGLDDKIRQKLAATSPGASWFILGNTEPLQRDIVGNPASSRAVVNNLCDARRFPDMNTLANHFTDRVLLGEIQSQAAESYLGGQCKRNKFNPAQAVSWEGLGTDFGALVLKNRRDGLKALVYNFGTTTNQGAVRVWELEHGEYRVRSGVDSNQDTQIDCQTQESVMELTRADRIPLAVAPRAVTVLEITQTRKLDPIFGRTDLAIAGREITIESNILSGIVHNIGSAAVADTQIAILDAQGKVVMQQSLGALEAPLDLVPRRKEFKMQLPPGPRQGWRLCVNPAGLVPEIYKGNNEVALDGLPAVDYRKGWER